MVGGAISRKLAERGVDVVTRTHTELDLTSQAAVRDFFAVEKVDGVVRQRPRLAASMRTTHTRPNSSTKI